jgi:hypothetical protein
VNYNELTRRLNETTATTHAPIEMPSLAEVDLSEPDVADLDVNLSAPQAHSTPIRAVASVHGSGLSSATPPPSWITTPV